jgi:hypothetical protein
MLPLSRWGAGRPMSALLSAPPCILKAVPALVQAEAFMARFVPGLALSEAHERADDRHPQSEKQTILITNKEHTNDHPTTLRKLPPTT